jgi:hypothetical protein
MTREDVIRMAREAGAKPSHNPDKWDIWEIRDTDLERFAALVAAHEREKCAQLCDVLAVHPEIASQVTKIAAAAIRARGEQ